MASLIKLKQIDFCSDMVENPQEWFKGYLGSSGINNGIGQKVNGSVTPVEFYIDAHATKHTIIRQVKVVIAAPDLKNYLFGFAPQLLTGYSLYYNKGTEIRQIHRAKTNGDLLLQAVTSETSFYGINQHNVINEYATTFDLLVITVDYQKLMGSLVLEAGSSDRISSLIEDNLSALPLTQLINLGTFAVGSRVPA